MVAQIEELTEENEKLKDKVQSYKKKVSDAEKRLSDAYKEISELRMMEDDEVCMAISLLFVSHLEFMRVNTIVTWCNPYRSTDINVVV